MTPERRVKIEKVLDNRQGNLVVVLENVYDPHNISAVLRTCDAVGVQDVYVLTTTIEPHRIYGARSSASAKKWVTVHEYDNLTDLVTHLRGLGFKLYSSHLGTDSISLYDINFDSKVALIFGNERHGVTQELVDACDGNFLIPQVGMIQSLNISVACAVTLYEAYRQKVTAGHYNQSMMNTEQYQKLKAQWEDNFKSNADDVSPID